MQENKSAREKMLSKLEKIGINTTASAIAKEATEEQLASLIAGLEKLRDNRLARFIVTLIQTQR